jgi:hypothetical protein
MVYAAIAFDDETKRRHRMTMAFGALAGLD